MSYNAVPIRSIQQVHRPCNHCHYIVAEQLSKSEHLSVCRTGHKKYMVVLPSA